MTVPNSPMNFRVPENLKRAIQDRRTIPFIGAGVSMAVKVETNHTRTPLFPSWKQLLERAAEQLIRYGKETEAKLVRTFLELRQPKYLDAAKYACEAFAPDDWYKFLQDNFDAESEEAVEGLELSRAIWPLSNGLIITTNYDNVLSWACPRARDVKKWFVQSEVQQADFLRRTLDKPTVWHLHGGIDQPETIILTPDGYSRLYANGNSASVATADRFEAAFDTLQSVMREYMLLFIGYSMTDKEIGDQIRLISETFQGATGHHFMLVRESDYDATERQLRSLRGLVDLVSFPDFGPSLVAFIEHLAALKNESVTPINSNAFASTSLTPVPKLSPLPVLDKSAFRRLFIGRERLLEDIRTALSAILEKEPDRWLDYRSAYVNLFWIHGHGGMGKSWLLRRAYIEAEERHPTVRLALIDWDAPQWREPLSQPPIDNEQLFTVIAHRLAQLFGTAALQRYWDASARVRAAKERFANLQLTFVTCLDRIVSRRLHGIQDIRGAHPSLNSEREETDEERKHSLCLENILRAAHLWSDQPETLNRQIKELLAEPIRKERIFEQWAERVTEASADNAVYQPGKVLAEALRDCLREVTTTSTLVLILDTCELLSPELDWWLRNLLAPLLNGDTSLLVIIGSRQRPDANTREGRSEGWVAEIPDRLRRIVQFDEAVRFTVEEIDAALHRLHRPPPESFELAERLHQATLGFPLALRVLFDLHEDGDEVLSDLAFGGDYVDECDLLAMEHVYERVSNRFLLHLEREHREEALRDVTALALFRQARVPILKRFWSCVNIKERIRPLELRYSLVSDGDLHEMVRKFLRLYWRKDSPQRILDMARELATIVQELEPAGGLEESAYLDWLIDRCEIASWLDGQEAFALFARTLAVALTFGHDAHLLGALAAEVPATETEAKKSKKLISSLADYHYFSSLSLRSDEILEWLNQQRSEAWTEIEKACLDLLNGLSLNRQSRHAEAIQKFHRAFAVFAGKELPRRYEIAQAYLNSVQARGQSMVALAQEAYDWATKFRFIENNLWNHDYYWVVHNACKYEEAESYCRKVIENYPHSLSAYAFLGHILSAHLERNEDAQETYRRGLEVEPDDPTLNLFLGNLLEAMGRFEEAETAYRKTLQLVISRSDEARVLVHLAKLLNSLNRPVESLAAFREARKNATEDPSILNSLAWALYSRNINIDEAEEAAKRAVANDPDDVNNLHTLAAILVRLNKWKEAKPKVERWLKEEKELKKSWHQFQPLFHDATKNGHVLELAELVPSRTEDTVDLVLRSVLRAIGTNAETFSELPPQLQNGATQLKEQILSNDIPKGFPEFPSVG